MLPTLKAYEMSAKRIIDFLPEFYEPLLPQFFHRTIPSEDLATCDACAMCRREGEPRLPEAYYYRPDSKCCTFYPSLPNYAVGALLLTQATSLNKGKRRVQALIEQGIGAIPHGLMSHPEYDIKYNKLRDRYFGKLPLLLCPYYDKDQDRCSIWPFRNSVCITYFCMSVRGHFGILFWESVRLYLSHIEEVLSAYALQAMGWPEDLVLQTSITKGQGRIDPASRKAHPPKFKPPFAPSLWMHHEGDKEKVYIEAYKLVSKLNSKDTESLAGAPSLTLLREVRQTYKRMQSKKIPERLKKNDSLKTMKRGGNVYLLLPNQGAYTVLETIWLALKYFNGERSCKEVVELVKKNHNFILTRSFLLALLRNSILVPVSQKEA